MPLSTATSATKQNISIFFARRDSRNRIKIAFFSASRTRSSGTERGDVRLLTDVAEVCEGVDEAVDEDEPAGELVELDVLVERQDHDDAELAQLGDAVPQHQHQDEHRREVEGLTCKEFGGQIYSMSSVMPTCLTETRFTSWQKRHTSGTNLINVLYRKGSASLDEIRFF